MSCKETDHDRLPRNEWLAYHHGRIPPSTWWLTRCFWGTSESSQYNHLYNQSSLWWYKPYQGQSRPWRISSDFNSRTASGVPTFPADKGIWQFSLDVLNHRMALSAWPCAISVVMYSGASAFNWLTKSYSYSLTPTEMEAIRPYSCMRLTKEIDRFIKAVMM